MSKEKENKIHLYTFGDKHNNKTTILLSEVLFINKDKKDKSLKVYSKNIPHPPILRIDNIESDEHLEQAYNHFIKAWIDYLNQ